MAFAATELMPSAIARFRRAHPHVDVRLQYIRTQGQKIALANGEIDAGYMIGPFDHRDYQSIQLSSETLYVVTPRNHPLLLRPTVTPADLANLGGIQDMLWKLVPAVTASVVVTGVATTFVFPILTIMSNVVYRHRTQPPAPVAPMTWGGFPGGRPGPAVPPGYPGYPQPGHPERPWPTDYPGNVT